MRLNVLLIILLMQSHFVMGTDRAEGDKKWVMLAIDGCKITTTRQTIEQSGVVFLINLLKGNFSTDKDKKGRILIDRPKAEGKLLSYYLREQKLPEKVDLEVATSAAAFFCIDPMLQEITERKKAQETKNKEKQWKFKRHSVMEINNHCPACNSGNYGLTELINHLTNAHDAQELQYIKIVMNKDSWFEILYKVPLIEPNPEAE